MLLFASPATDATRPTIELTNPCFISDLHLNVSNAAHLEAFGRFMHSVAPAYDELLILGDCFDYWVGDDAIETARSFIDLLAEYGASKKLFFMHGNRDFMLGVRFASACHATLLADPIVIEAKGESILLSHGDIWCTMDLDYQKVRRRVRNPWWQRLILFYPLKKRLEIAQKARKQSYTQKTVKTQEAMDVVDEAIRSSIHEYAPLEKNIHTVIHGHTHRPGHRSVGKGLSRWVLPDWRENAQGCLSPAYLYLSDTGPRIQTLESNG